MSVVLKFTAPLLPSRSCPRLPAATELRLIEQTLPAVKVQTPLETQRRDVDSALWWRSDVFSMFTAVKLKELAKYCLYSTVWSTNFMSTSTPSHSRTCEIYLLMHLKGAVHLNVQTARKMLPAWSGPFWGFFSVSSYNDLLHLLIMHLHLATLRAASRAFSQLSATTPYLMGHGAKITLVLFFFKDSQVSVIHVIGSMNYNYSLLLIPVSFLHC